MTAKVHSSPKGPKGRQLGPANSRNGRCVSIGRNNHPNPRACQRSYCKMGRARIADRSQAKTYCLPRFTAWHGMARNSTKTVRSMDAWHGIHTIHGIGVLCFQPDFTRFGILASCPPDSGTNSPNHEICGNCAKLLCRSCIVSCLSERLGNVQRPRKCFGCRQSCNRIRNRLTKWSVLAGHQVAKHLATGIVIVLDLSFQIGESRFQFADTLALTFPDFRTPASKSIAQD